MLMLLVEGKQIGATRRRQFASRVYRGFWLESRERACDPIYPFLVDLRFEPEEQELVVFSHLMFERIWCCKQDAATVPG